MGDIIQFAPRSHSCEPNRATSKALMDEAVDEASLGFTDAEMNDLREALNHSNRAQLIENVRKQCLAVRVLLSELLDSYRTHT